jgi:hypothetical protein
MIDPVTLGGATTSPERENMNPKYYDIYEQVVGNFLRENDIYIVAGILFVLAFIGMAAICYLYIIWMFGGVFDSEDQQINYEEDERGEDDGGADRVDRS